MATSHYNRPVGTAATPWQDWLNLILGVWLFISPWVLSFAVGGRASTQNPAGAAAGGGAMLANAAWNAWVLGIIVALVAISALTRTAAWQEGLNLLLGIWVFIAPWVLGFSGAANAAWDHWIVGFLVFVFALAGLSAARRAVPTTTADLAHAGGKPMMDRPLDRPLDRP
jgi:hypothetical protein